MKKITLSIVMSAFTITLSLAQIGLGTSANLMIGRISVPSFGILGEFGFKNKYTTRVSLNYFLPQINSGTIDAKSISSPTSNISVPYIGKLNLMSFNIDFKRYCKNGNIVDGGFYYGLGATLFFVNFNETYNYDTFNKNDYELNSKLNNMNSFQLKVKGILGYEKSFKFGSLYIEGHYIITPFYEDEQAFGFALPKSRGLSIGYKYILGKK